MSYRRHHVTALPIVLTVLAEIPLTHVFKGRTVFSLWKQKAPPVFQPFGSNSELRIKLEIFKRVFNNIC